MLPISCRVIHSTGILFPIKEEMLKEIIVVEGNDFLEGQITVSGAKNSALKLMAATILGQGKTILHNVPIISDIAVMGEVLEHLGAHVERSDHSLVIDTTHINNHETSYALVSKMRASIAVLGALVGRFGKARVAMPGGCQIGARKIDMHLVGLEALGVEFTVDHGYLSACVPDGLKGVPVVLEFPSVGATENLLMAAIVAEGKTVIENAAREPEIVDLAEMLSSMGACITGAGSPTIEIHGVPLNSLGPCEHTTVGDRIEAGTFLAGAALMGGPVTVRGIDPSFLRMTLIKFEAMGCEVEVGDDSIMLKRSVPLKAIDIQTLPHPGFPTDLQAQFMVLAAVAEGNSIITENVFENRFMCASELMRMGADITIESHHALIRGVKGLQGAPVSCTDLRAGAALVMAGIHAEGKTHVYDIDHIDRGYEDYVGKLNSLGAKISRVVIDKDSL